MKATIIRQQWTEATLEDAQEVVRETANGLREAIVGVLLGSGGRIPRPLPGPPRRQPPSSPGNPPHVQTGVLLTSPKVRVFKYVAHINMTDYALIVDDTRPYLDQAIEGYLQNDR